MSKKALRIRSTRRPESFFLSRQQLSTFGLPLQIQKCLGDLIPLAHLVQLFLELLLLGLQIFQLCLARRLTLAATGLPGQRCNRRLVCCLCCPVQGLPADAEAPAQLLDLYLPFAHQSYHLVTLLAAQIFPPDPR